MPTILPWLPSAIDITGEPERNVLYGRGAGSFILWSSSPFSHLSLLRTCNSVLLSYLHSQIRRSRQSLYTRKLPQAVPRNETNLSFKCLLSVLEGFRVLFHAIRFSRDRRTKPNVKLEIRRSRC